MKILFLVPFSHAFMAYPIYKWSSQLTANGLHFSVRGRLPKDLESFNSVVLTSAFCAHQRKQGQHRKREKTRTALDSIRKNIELFRRNGMKVLFFDSRDGNPSNYFDILPDVDVFLKKQHLKDKVFYTTDEYASSPSAWLGGNRDTKIPKARLDQLDKIKLAWNIGYEDFGGFRRAGKIASLWGITFNPQAKAPRSNRPILTAFRGSFGGSRRGHRAQLVQKLQEMNLPEIKMGPTLRRRAYLRELSRCMISVSPFGFGEPCYRDFESILEGATLVKPTMGHLVTFPDIYNAWETYVPVSWDFGDLLDQINALREDEELRIKIAETAQKKYLLYLTEPELFVSHAKRIFQSKD